MNRQIGVDFGTTTSVLAYRDFEKQNEGPENLIKFEGRDYVPTMVLQEGSITNKKGMEIRHEECFGWDAAKATSFHALLKRDFKMGLISNNAAVRSEAKVLTEKFFRYMYERYTAGAITQKGTQFEKISTVVTYPGKFPEEVQQILKKAAEDAGFPNVTLVDESKAAMKFALSYDTEDTKEFFQNRQGKKLKVMIIDMGAGTTDISVFEYDTADPSNFVHLCSWPEKGGNNFGGSEIDGILCNFYKEKMGATIVRILGTGNAELGEKLLRNKIKEFKEQTISDVLGRNEDVMDLPGDLVPIKYSMPEEPDTDLDRAAFEELLKDYLPQFPDLVYGALNTAWLNGNQVDLVLLTGGHSQWYFVKEMLVKAGISGGSILSFPEPHLVVARGAVWYGTQKKAPAPKTEPETKQEILSNELDVDSRKVPIVAQGDIKGFGKWTLDEAGLLTIDGKGKMPNWDINEENGTVNTPWWNYRNQINSASVSSGATIIGEGAFAKCENLVRVRISNSITSIGEGVFWDCTSLTHVIIPNSVTSIGYAAFQGCTNLTKVTIPNGVNSIESQTFAFCNRLNQVTIPNSVTSIGCHAFHDCRSLTQLAIPKSLTFIGEYAFSCCTSLIQVTIPDSVTFIGPGVFGSCTSLTHVSIPNSVTSIGAEAFLGCTSLTQVTIPDSVTFIGDCAFMDCTGLTRMNIPNSITTIPDGTFSGCTSLTHVTIPNSATSIGVEAFLGCTSLTQVTIPDGVTSIGPGAFIECTSLMQVTIPNSVISIGDAAFGKCSSLTYVIIPNSVASIGICAFNECTGLTRMNIPNSITTIADGTFLGCTSLILVSIPNSVTSIGDCAFAECTSLTQVTIPNSVTSIGDCAFAKCTSLTQVTIPDSVTSIGGGAFMECAGLTRMSIPKSVRLLGEAVFEQCSTLRQVYMPRGYNRVFGFQERYGISKSIVTFI